MSMTRADAATHINDVYAELLAQSGLGTEDDVGQLKSAIDRAMLSMSVAYADLQTATVSDEYGFQRVLEWTALVRIRNAFGLLADKSHGGPASLSKRYGDAIRDLNERIAMAKTAAEPFITVTTSDVYAMTSINYDYLEPGPV